MKPPWVSDLDVWAHNTVINHDGEYRNREVRGVELWTCEVQETTEHVQCGLCQKCGSTRTQVLPEVTGMDRIPYRGPAESTRV